MHPPFGRTADDRGGILMAKYAPFFQSDVALNRNPPLRLHKRLFTEPQGSASELAFDALISPDNPPTSWVHIQGGYTYGGFTHQTNHLRGEIPTGGNVLLCDGHVD